MKKFAALAALATALSFSAMPAEANGWGNRGNSNTSGGGLLNLSPSIQTGNLNLLSGIGILNNSSILSGNVLSGIVKGNGNNVGQGNVSGRGNFVGNGLIGGSFNSHTTSGKRR